MKAGVFIFALCILLAVSCGPLSRKSPFSESTLTQANRLNDQSIASLEALDQTPQDIILLSMSDSHQNYDDLSELVGIMNGFSGDMITHTGDFTNQGYNFEYDLFISAFTNLKLPHVVAFGNHDTNVRGKALYNRLFGDFNRRFEFRGYRFLIFNNNNLDFYYDGKVDWDWLDRQVSASTLPVVIFMHVNPDNTGYFTDEDRARFWGIIQGSKVRLIMNGHEHVWYTEMTHGALRHQVARVEGLQWSRVTLKANEVVVERCKGRTCSHDTTEAFP
ncbi:3',5'-cyclic adenosine monophosphate phosphodiesterase CpdA [compost metagenome]